MWTELDRGPQAANLKEAAAEALASIDPTAASTLRSALAHRVQSLQRVYQASAHPEVAKGLGSALDALFPGVEATSPPPDFRMSDPIQEEGTEAPPEAGKGSEAGGGDTEAACGNAGGGTEGAAEGGGGKSEEDEASAVSDATSQLIFSMLPYIAGGDASSSKLVLCARASGGALRPAGCSLDTDPHPPSRHRRHPQQHP